MFCVPVQLPTVLILTPLVPSSDNCRGLCGVPPGLSTKCSQQYVQKKLVALHPSGDRLGEDMFWFPSCCVCQVTRE